MASITLPKSKPTTVPEPWMLAKVSIRKKWSDDWTFKACLECLVCVITAAPTIPQARLRWRSGLIRREDVFIDGDGGDASGFDNVAPLDLVGQYVKIEYLTAPAGSV